LLVLSSYASKVGADEDTMLLGCGEQEKEGAIPLNVLGWYSSSRCLPKPGGGSPDILGINYTLSKNLIGFQFPSLLKECEHQ